MPGRFEMNQQQATLRSAVASHLVEEGFGDDGGVNERWAVTRVGPVPICIPNMAMRRKAVPHHDANHVISGYDHDLIGESEIGAWELGGGCRRYVAAWVLNWSALVPGLVLSPRRMFRAFVRGRHSGNLYGHDLDDVRDLSLDDVRRLCALDGGEHRPTLSDCLAFALVVVLAPLVALIPVLVALLTSPVWLAEGAHRRRRVAPVLGEHSAQ